MHHSPDRRRAPRRLLVVLAALLGLVAALLVTSSQAQAAPPSASRWIVVLDGAPSPRAADVAAEHSRRFGLDVTHTYGHALNGYAAVVPDAALDGLRRDPRVAYVAPDTPVSLVATQTNPPWGLDRIDQRSLPLSGTYTYTSTGAGVNAYIIDTGIYRAHSDFGGRAVTGYDAIVPGGNAEDCHGHGTHVAGTVGGARYGIAKGVRLVAVRVLSCAGTGLTSGVIAGVDWVTRDHDANEAAVANMSLGGGANDALDQAVRNSIADGVTYAVAAGNETADACGVSPARVAQAVTVGATDNRDRAADFSNFGPCVDLFAPGVDIQSAFILTPTSSATMSGTSMASPHVAGAAALYLQRFGPSAPSTVHGHLQSTATQNIVTGTNTANNDLLYVGS